MSAKVLMPGAYMLVVTCQASSPLESERFYTATVDARPWSEVGEIVFSAQATSRNEKHAISYALTELAIAFQRGQVP